MSNLLAISKSEFCNRSWQRNPNFLCSAKDAVCPLSASETPRAMMSMPLAFMCTDEKYSLVAVQGLQPGENFFLDAQGKWLGGYIPAAYRAYPFVLATNEAEKEQLVLCIDTDSGLLIEDDSCEPFFDESDKLSPALEELVKFLSNVRAGRQKSARICETLLKLKLFKPWDLEFELESGTKRIEGLFCIDETALNALSEDAYAELRSVGAVPLIYCQLLSMQRIFDLTRFAQAKSKLDLPPQTNDLDLDFDGTNTEGNISFDNL